MLMGTDLQFIVSDYYILMSLLCLAIGNKRFYCLLFYCFSSVREVPGNLQISKRSAWSSSIQ